MQGHGAAMPVRSQLTRAAIGYLNATLQRLAERVERHNDERENDRLAALVQDAMHERGTG